MRADALTPSQCEAWQAFRAARPEFAAPYFALEFTRAMAAVRPDTWVLSLTRNGTQAGFLPLQLSRSGVARPIGGPLGDHHAIIAEDASLDLRSALGQAGIGLFAFHGGLAGDPALASSATSKPTPSWVSDLSNGYDALIEDCRKADAKAMRNIRARQRKLDALDATVEIRIDDRRPEALAALIESKREQYRRTRALDVFAARWTGRLIEDLFERREPGLAGVLSTLEIDGQLAAAHFGMRSESVLHYWFPVYWPDYAHLGPGLTLYMELARQLSEDGITQIHLGPGEYDFKKRLSNASFDVITGQVSHPSLASAIVATGQLVDRTAQSLPLGRFSEWPGKAFRRFDKWAAVHAF